MKHYNFSLSNIIFNYLISCVNDEKNKQGYLPRITPTRTKILESIVNNKDNAEENQISYTNFPNLDANLYMKISIPKNIIYKNKFEYKPDEVILKILILVVL